MTNRTALVVLWTLAFSLRAANVQSADAPHVLLHDDFDDHRSETWLGVVDAHPEYQYVKETAAKGPWSVSTFRSEIGWQNAWRIVGDGDGGKLLAQTYRNRSTRHAHPLVVAGDPLWSDYTLTVEFAPESLDARSGVVFRCRNDRCYYFFGVDKGRGVLLLVQHESAFRTPYERVLGETPLAFEPGQSLTAVVTVDGDRIAAQFDRGTAIEAVDRTYSVGNVGLLADAPAQYMSVRVACSPSQAEQTAALIAERQQVERDLQAANPTPVPWKRVNLASFGVGRNVRFGDLDGDGQLDLLIGQVTHHGPKDRNSELSCLTALTLDGKTLWQIGEPDAWKQHLTNDVAFQINDLDGDGRAEVVYTMGQELIVADGATGKTLRKTATPSTSGATDPVYQKFPRVLGDSLLLCDLRGAGRAADIVLKDRYSQFWTFDSELRPLWEGRCNTGHYPYPVDVDRDGRDELAVGYSLFDDDGRQLWTLDKELKDHADGVAIVRLADDATAEPTVVCCASDEGVYFADIRGAILRHHRIGHAQNITIANLRDDLPGLETVAINFWGSQGIVHFFDSRGELYHDVELCQHGSPCLATNWSGKSEEFFLLTANAEEGGLFDGLGRRVVRFPDDGHPDMCCAALDLTGDCRDEIVVWNPYELWVYTQSDNPKQSRLYRPARNPLHNESNYRACVSTPGWSN